LLAAFLLFTQQQVDYHPRPNQDQHYPGIHGKSVLLLEPANAPTPLAGVERRFVTSIRQPAQTPPPRLPGWSEGS
jgi:hypothetical protein